MKLTATQSFTTTVLHRGGNVYVRGIKGEGLDLDPEIFALVEKDVPGALVEAKAPKPKATRQVKKAPNRTKK